MIGVNNLNLKLADRAKAIMVFTTKSFLKHPPYKMASHTVTTIGGIPVVAYIQAGDERRVLVS